MDASAPPMLIALPHGFNVSGVTTWALRLANGLAQRGRAVGLVTHDEPPGRARLDAPIDSRVRVFEARGLPAFEVCNGDLAPFAPVYRHAVESLAREAGGPVVFSPNLAADCYGVAAALTLVMPESVRAIGWLHNDTPFDGLVLSRYEPSLHRLVGVSARLTAKLRAALPARAQDVAHIPYGVEVPQRLATRRGGAGEPIRLLYTGRMDHDQKRVGALVHMAAALRRAGAAFTLTLLGDGPAADEIDAALRDAPNARRLPATGPDGVRKALLESDLLVLPSRFEGLSVSMLEALAAGCPPVAARVESGADEAIEPGVSGALVDVGPDANAQTTGQALAEAVAELARSPSALAAMREAAWHRAQERFAMDAHLDAVEALIGAVASEPPRVWPADRPCAFTTSSVCGGVDAGSVPADAPRRLAAALRTIVRKTSEARVALWGTGRHTIAVAAELATSPVEIVGFIDDDPVRAGGSLWGWPIAAPAEVKRLGATHVVISSWMHEERIWARRSAVEAQGVAVAPLYRESAPGQSAPSAEIPQSPPNAATAA